jgi:hypothetical protein
MDCIYWVYFTGHSADGTAGECPNPAAPGALKTGSAYFVPRLFLNYPTGTSGVTDVDEIAIDIIPENADQIAESSTKKWAGESGADVTANHQDDINIDNIQDGSSYKKLSARIWRRCSRRQRGHAPAPQRLGGRSPATVRRPLCGRPVL